MNAAIEIIKKQINSWKGCELQSLSYSSDNLCNNTDNIAWMNDLEEANDNKEVFTQCIMFESIFVHLKMAVEHGLPMKNIHGLGGWLVAKVESGD